LAPPKESSSRTDATCSSYRVKPCEAGQPRIAGCLLKSRRAASARPARGTGSSSPASDTLAHEGSCAGAEPPRPGTTLPACARDGRAGARACGSLPKHAPGSCSSHSVRLALALAAASWAEASNAVR